MEDRQSKRLRMLALVSDFEGSEKSLKSYCSEVGIKPHTYYYWKRQSESMRPNSGFEAIRIKAIEKADPELFLRLSSGVEIHGIGREALIELALEIDCRHAEF